MNKIFTQEFNDSYFKSFAKRFLFCNDRKQEILQRSLYSSIVYSLVSLVNQNPFRPTPIQGGLRKIDKTVTHLFWYVLWTIKWFILFRYSKKEDIINTALFMETSSSIDYLKLLCIESEKKDVVIVNFGMIYNYPMLFRQNIYCHPFIIERYNLSDNNKNESEKLSRMITKNIPESIDLNVLPTLEKDIQRLLVYYNVVEIYIAKIKKNKNIRFYLSDTDHLDTRTTLCELHRSAGIRTILIDHALNSFNCINNQVYSDQYLCWGEFQKISFFANASQINVTNVVIPVGRPSSFFQATNSIRAQRWIYYLPSFQHQTKFSILRSYSRTKEFITAFEEFIQTSNAPAVLSIQTHPVDTLVVRKKFNHGISTITTGKISEGCELIIIEDSSIIIDLLQYDIPILYISNANGDDSMAIDKLKVGRIATSPSEIGSILPDLLKTPFNPVQRSKAFDYYIQPDHNMSSFKKHIQSMLVN